MKKSFISRQWPIVVWYLLILFGLIITLIPFIWPAASSLKSNEAIFDHLDPFSIKAFLPGADLSAYTTILNEKGFGVVVIRTLIVTFVTVFLGIFINSLAGFAFAYFDFPGKNIVFFIVLEYASLYMYFK